MRTFFLVLAAAVLLPACGGNDGGSGTDDSGPGTGIDGQAPNPDNDGSVQPADDSGVPSDATTPIDAGGVVIGTDAGAWVCYPTTCNDKLLECGNCMDDDGDGLVDSEDHECLGPCDNTEGPALNAGVGGETGATCGADCYWDFGNGPGNDMCAWDYRCDPFAPKAGCGFDETKAADPSSCPAEQPQLCQDFCSPLTPNGCDCFGCCTFPELAGQGPDGTDVYVWIGSVTNGGTGTCTFADVQDPDKCPVCTPQPSCFNDCKTCELCIGKPELPDECYPPPDADPDAGAPPPPQECPSGLQACGLEGQDPCVPGFYCISGCCREAIL